MREQEKEMRRTAQREERAMRGKEGEGQKQLDKETSQYKQIEVNNNTFRLKNSKHCIFFSTIPGPSTQNATQSPPQRLQKEQSKSMDGCGVVQLTRVRLAS